MSKTIQEDIGRRQYLADLLRFGVLGSYLMTRCCLRHQMEALTC